MFSRLRATIDRTISEEQARQQKALDDQKSSASNSSQRNGSRARASSGTGTQSPARKARSAKKASEDLNLEGVAANPDPAFFEAAFVIDEPDETGTPARIATPVSADKKMNNNTPPKDAEAPADSSKDSTESQQNGGKGDQVNVDSVLSEKSASTAPSGANELSPEVRARLRKLDKLEKAYPELLRSYRIAHARVAAIEPFETALKENTPLTSIREPDALVEYLNQLKLKGDMVMDELKRVTGEKDTHKKKADEAEKELTALKEEVVALKAASAESPAVDADAAVNATEEPKTTTEGQHSSTPSAAKSPVSRVIGVFSPKQKPAEPTESKDGQEFFSYEDELPQLQAEVEKKSEEIQKLTTEVLNLKEELSVAKEHSTGLSESLEIANRALSESRDAFAVKKFVETQLEARKAEITTLTERLNKTQSRLKELEAQLETQKTDANAALEEKSTELTTYMSRNDALEAHVKILADAKSATIDRLTSEIKELTKTKADYEAKIGQLEKKLESTPIPPAPLASTATPLDNSLAPPASTGSKKKNKKKKKGGASAAPAAPEHTPSEVSVGMEPLPSPAETSASGELQLEVDRLREEVAKKDQRIENLSKQRKTEEDLREEIVNLQENLMVIGDDHVQAKDRIKHLEAEKTALKQRISELEKELESSASSAKTNTKLQREYESLKQEFDDLKLKSSTLQSDLAAAQQLAQTRYKDLTDLRGVVQTVQPELKSLRQESATLKTTKEELATKNTELRNLEKREKELKTELTRAQRLASDREAEIKSLHEKVTQETNARLRLEDDKRVAGRDLRRSEAEKIELSAKEEKATRELQRVQEEASKLRPRIKQLEDEVAQLKKEQEVLREETELKTSHSRRAKRNAKASTKNSLRHVGCSGSAHAKLRPCEDYLPTWTSEPRIRSTRCGQRWRPRWRSAIESRTNPVRSQGARHARQRSCGKRYGIWRGRSRRW
ncbi:hypothetical protein B0H66DRAFT_91743 [Apodospora peruviana]|uniref:Uncharacterized protein n=1 Tax=Apodospora peruviana TaxID=516989 RepID=A0AAE0MHG7_9PEZI|nr:hypothetical protein B0H66DRAFT_91743 [Apodospora peruviana]